MAPVLCSYHRFIYSINLKQVMNTGYIIGTLFYHRDNRQPHQDLSGAFPIYTSVIEMVKALSDKNAWAHLKYSLHNLHRLPCHQ